MRVENQKPDGQGLLAKHRGDPPSGVKRQVGDVIRRWRQAPGLCAGLDCTDVFVLLTFPKHQPCPRPEGHRREGAEPGLRAFVCLWDSSWPNADAEDHSSSHPHLRHPCLRCSRTTFLPVAGLQLNFTASWGDLHYLGLTGLEVVGKDGQALPISLHQISACPRDLNDLPEHTDDSRTLDK